MSVCGDVTYNLYTSFCAPSTNDKTLFICSWLTVAPTVVSSSAGSPSFMASVLAMSFSVNSSLILFSTNTLVPLEQTCKEIRSNYSLIWKHQEVTKIIVFNVTKIFKNLVVTVCTVQAGGDVILNIFGPSYKL